ncbi:bifunctional DNA-formamidopyrimidine glycosylase/DNA-(apurinic or apyrimidinic site) lyase [Candidatus Uhrbacteria bacterium]|nr:bifunctional DNA-formamidopyrimidine glycosylase/DNA-(apurinic or apyrimidinic site) lyase [Candidatus Uhrbacteria bacterium]
MPELPEVETIRRQLASAVSGRRIDGVTVRYAGRLNVPAPEFAQAVVGARFQDFGRRAKLLLVNLSNGWTIVTHLKMTGRYLLKPGDAVPEKHVHVVFKLDDGRQLFFEDTRKFGYLKLVRTAELEEKIYAKEKYGPEPLEKSFTFDRFKTCLIKRSKKKIKPLLMEQSCIAGIGNIYADEACWYGAVRPTRRVATLSDKELRGVYRGALTSLGAAVKARGSSAVDYVDLYGKRGDYVPRLKVYDRAGKKCSRCSGVIKKIWIGGRGAHYCPKCQR